MSSLQRSVSELEAATGEKKGGGDVSGVRYQFTFFFSSQFFTFVSSKEKYVRDVSEVR